MNVDDDAPDLVPLPLPYLPQERHKVLVTILTGFLGAGKSTLLSRILKERHGWKVAVIMNELGPSGGVDKAMIFEQTGHIGEEWLEVENGCLCCTAKNETFLAIESLLMRRLDIEHVIIEASGAADPSSLVQKLWVDEALESRVTLNAVICVIDSSTAETLLSSTSLHHSIEASRQVAIADIILLNKIDLIPEMESDRIESIIKIINPIARIVRTRFASIPLKEMLFLRKYSSSILEERDSIIDLLDRARSISITSHSPQVIRSFTVYLKNPLDYMEFERWLFTLLWERRIGQRPLMETDLIMRIKGTVLLQPDHGIMRLYYLQVVQDKYELEPFTDQSVGRNSALIFIGRIDDSTENAIKTTITHSCCLLP